MPIVEIHLAQCSPHPGPVWPGYSTEMETFKLHRLGEFDFGFGPELI